MVIKKIKLIHSNKKMIYDNLISLSIYLRFYDALYILIKIDQHLGSYINLCKDLFKQKFNYVYYLFL